MNGTAVQEMRRDSAGGSVFLNADRRKKACIILFSTAISLLAVVLLIYGGSYYFLEISERPFSPEHGILKPSGKIGLRLGMVGFGLFVLVYLYPLRKHWAYLGRIGRTTNWFDYHVMFGLTAPVVITFHSAFKFQGFAGLAYWTMVALVASGIVGRYLYAQIPRNLNAAEMTLNEMQDLKTTLLHELSKQKALCLPILDELFKLPDSAEVQTMSAVRALFRMLALDVARPFKIWSLRRRSLQTGGRPVYILVLMRTRDSDLEKAIQLASKQAALSKRILFLSRARRIFHAWHIIHRPCSISFAVFVVIHVGVVIWLGYF